MTAAGALTAGSITSAGGASTNVGAGAGGNVKLTAGAALSVGASTPPGPRARMGGTHGGAVSVTGASVALGAITADAGDATLRRGRRQR